MFTNGEWIGRPFRLLPWQKRLLLSLFEIDPDGLRRYRWALLGVPKKNGKTELAAALALYFLIGDGEPSPLVVCAAASEEQADLVFGAARRMAELSPTLSRVTARFDKEILVPSIPGAKLRRVAASVGTNDGQNIHAVICDELHEWAGAKGEAVWHVLTNGTGARRQPMVFQITTAGYDLETICGQQYTYGQRVNAGEVADRRYYFEWSEAPEGADHRDPKVWAAANPSYGVIVHPAFFEDQLKKPESVFRRYFLNQWTASEESWLPPRAWLDCEASVGLDPSLPIYVGIDAARTHDSSAVVISQPRDGRIVQRAKVWDNPYQPEDARHDAWRLELAVIENYLLELFEAYPAPAAAAEKDGPKARGPAFYFDPWRFDRSAELLVGKGLNMQEVPQTDSRMAPACMAYYDLIATKVIAHDGNVTFARHIAAASRKDVSDRAWRLTKPRGSRKKIDAAIAGAISAYFAHAVRFAPPAFRSNYETERLTVSRAH